MDIFEFAMKMEEDGKNYYLELAGKASDEGIQNILKGLAADEEKHFAVLKQMKDEQPVMVETNILDKAKNIFTEMKDKGVEIDVSTTPVHLYEKAKEIEERSIKFYQDMSAEMENEEQKNLFQMLAEEEKRHVFLLENVIDFVSKPQIWLENAEFNHLEDY
jgi:rubrerythrin